MLRYGTVPDRTAPIYLSPLTTPTPHVLEVSNSGEPENPSKEKPANPSGDETSSADEDPLRHVLRAHARLRDRRKHERLSVPTTVRFAPSDVEVIEARAASVGLSFSTYVRAATLAAGEEPLLGALFADRLQDTLSRVRNSLITKTKAAVRSELKKWVEPRDKKETDTPAASEEQPVTLGELGAPDLSRAILRVIVPTVEEEMKRLEETLEAIRRQYPVQIAPESREDPTESSQVGESGDDEE